MRAPADLLVIAERAVYFLASVALVAAAAAGLFVVLAIDIVSSDTGDITQTVVTVLERMSRHADVGMK